MSETSANYTTGLTTQHMLETQPLPCLLRYPHPPATILHTPETQARTFSTDPEMHATPKRQHSSAKAIQHPARPYSPTARHSVPAQQSSGKAAWRGCPEISHLPAATHHNIDTTTDTEQHNSPPPSQRPPAPPTQQHSCPAPSQLPPAPHQCSTGSAAPYPKQKTGTAKHRRPGHRRSLNNAMRRPSTGTRRPERAPYLITFPSLNAVPIRAPMAR